MVADREAGVRVVWRQNDVLIDGFLDNSRVDIWKSTTARQVAEQPDARQAYPADRGGSGHVATTPGHITAIRDEDLIARLQRRDTAAFVVLYDSYSRMAFGLAYRLLEDSAAAGCNPPCGTICCSHLAALHCASIGS